MASIIEEIFGPLARPQIVVNLPPMDTLRCPGCGQYFAVEKSTVKQFFAGKQGLHCPNGHKLIPRKRRKHA